MPNQTPFSQQIAYLGKGAIDEEATDALAQVVQAVRTTRKKGQVTLVIDVSMLDQRSEDSVAIQASVKQKVPQLPSPKTVMFSTHDGDLLRDDPDQQTLELRQVEQPDVTFKRAPTGNKVTKVVGGE